VFFQSDIYYPNGIDDDAPAKRQEIRQKALLGLTWEDTVKLRTYYKNCFNVLSDTLYKETAKKSCKAAFKVTDWNCVKLIREHWNKSIL